MKSIKILLGAVALALMSSQVFAATPVPLASSSATQTPAAAATPARVMTKKVGTSANFLTFVDSGTCVVNPGSIAIGGSALYTCTVTGAAVGDKVLLAARPVTPAVDVGGFYDRDCWVLQSWEVSAANTVRLRITNRESSVIVAEGACDPPAITFDYFLFRPNPHAD